MTPLEILQFIDENNLTIRKLPSGYRTTVSTAIPSELQAIKNNTLILKEGTELLTFTVRDAYPSATDKIIERLIKEHYPDNKVYRLKKTEPYKYSGFYMCKRVDDTGSTVQWSVNTDNLASTLEESVQLYINSIAKEGTK